MKKIIFASILCSMSVAVNAVPTVSNVRLSQLPNRTVVVTYHLDEPAVVTFDLLTNAIETAGVSIGDKNLQRVWGDVNKRVEGPGDFTLNWAARHDWPNHLIADGSVKAIVKAWAVDAPPNYMVVDLQTPGAIRYYESTEQLPHGGLSSDLYRTSLMAMRRIPAKGVQWRMGSPSTEDGRSNESWEACETTHYVTLTEDYYMAVFELTQHQAYYLGKQDGTATIPASGMSYIDLRGATESYNWPANGHAVDPNSLIGKLRTRTGIDSFDLPTEAQWEFAARAGSSGPYAADSIDLIAWYNGNSEKQKHRVGELAPNAFGLYDMHGNVCEICLDWYKRDLGSDTVVDPAGPNESSDYRTLRGGSYDQPANNCRSAYRQPWCKPDNAFVNSGCRLICAPEAK